MKLSIYLLFTGILFMSQIVFASYTAPQKEGALQSVAGMHYGDNGQDLTADATYVQKNAASAGLIRMEMGLTEVDGIGTEHFDHYDYLLNKMKSTGCYALILINATCYPGETYWGALESNFSSLVSTYGAGCRRLANYYRGKGYRNIIFEFINEPDALYQGRMTSSKYVSLVNVGAQNVKAVFPEALTCSGGLAEPNLGFLNEIALKLDYGNLNYIGYHAYNSDNDWPEYANGAPLTGDSGRIKQMRDKFMSRGVDILMTEASWNVRELADEVLRAAYYERSWLVHIRERVEGAVLFRDGGTGPGSSNTDPESRMPPKKAMLALPFIKEAFPGNPKDYGSIVPAEANSVGISIGINGACWTVGRNLSGQKTIALWLGPNQGNSNTADLLCIPAKYKSAQWIDLRNPSTGWMNRTVKQGTTNSVIGIPLTQTPVIVRLSESSEVNVKITSPVNGATVQSPVTITWTGNDSYYKLFRDGVKVHSEYSLSGSIHSYPDTTVLPGTHTYELRGNNGTSDTTTSTVSVTVKTTDVNVNITSPVNNATVQSPVTITWTGNDKYYKLFRDGVKVHSEYSLDGSIHSYVDTTVLPGAHTYELKGNNGTSDTTTSIITLTITSGIIYPTGTHAITIIVNPSGAADVIQSPSNPIPDNTDITIKVSPKPGYKATATGTWLYNGQPWSTVIDGYLWITVFSIVSDAVITVNLEPLYGDLNGDTIINEDDADQMLQYVFGEKPELDTVIKSLATHAGLPNSPTDIRLATWILNNKRTVRNNINLEAPIKIMVPKK